MVLVVIVEYKNIVPSSEDSEEVRELYLLYSYWEGNFIADYKNKAPCL